MAEEQGIEASEVLEALGPHKSAESQHVPSQVQPKTFPWFWSRTNLDCSLFLQSPLQDRSLQSCGMMARVTASVALRMDANWSLSIVIPRCELRRRKLTSFVSAMQTACVDAAGLGSSMHVTHSTQHIKDVQHSPSHGHKSGL